MPENDLDRWDRTNNILAEVFGETEEQFDKWGEQNHPLTTPGDPTGIYLLGRTYAMFEGLTKQKFAQGQRSWALIELEEIFEALAARTTEEARAEWVQVAAVAVSVIASIDRAAGVGPGGPPLVGESARRMTNDVFLPGDGSVIVNDEIRIKADSPPEGIVLCGRCPHPDHREGNGRCAFQVPGPDPSGSIETCRCGDTPTRDLKAIDAQTGKAFDLGKWLLSGEPVTPEEIDSNYSKDLDEDAPRRGPSADLVIVDETPHRHDFGRLHGLCQCGEARTEDDG